MRICTSTNILARSPYSASDYSKLFNSSVFRDTTGANFNCNSRNQPSSSDFKENYKYWCGFVFFLTKHYLWKINETLINSPINKNLKKQRPLCWKIVLKTIETNRKIANEVKKFFVCELCVWVKFVVFDFVLNVWTKWKWFWAKRRIYDKLQSGLYVSSMLF